MFKASGPQTYIMNYHPKIRYVRPQEFVNIHNVKIYKFKI